MYKLYERIVTFSFLLMVIGVLTVLFIGAGLHERSVAEGSISTLGGRISETLIYAGAATLVVFRYRQTALAARVAWPFLMVAMLAIVSTAWSVDPGTTLRRSLVLLSTTIFGIYLGGRLTVHNLQTLLLQFFLFMVAASLVLLCIAPNYAIDTYHNGAFRGITEHKNRFGEYMGIFLLVALTYRFRVRWGLAQVGAVILAASLLLASRSGTSLLALTITLLLLPSLAIVRFTQKQVVPLAVLGAALVSLVGLALSRFSGSVLDLLGKDSTLTGRAEIWAGALASIGRRPLLGYGYDAFWQGLKGESLQIVARVQWLVPHAHNGYLEGLLGLGIIGMGLLLICVLQAGSNAAMYLRNLRKADGFWPFAFLLYFLIHATAEASLVEREGLSYLLFVATSTSLALECNRAVKASTVSKSALSSLERAAFPTGSAMNRAY